MKPITIGVAGGSGSGKTTVALNILEQVGFDHIAFLAHDSYYRDGSQLPMSERILLNYDHPDSLENELLIQHIEMLRSGNAVEVPVYDFKTHTRTHETRHVEPQQVILIDGILIFADKRLRDLMDVRIFVDTAADLRFIRRLQRDIKERGRTAETVIEQYMSTVRPMHLEFVEPSKRYAHVIIPEGGFNDVAISMVSAKIQSLLPGVKHNKI
ncbi:MAG: uridine kinase [Gammaproteobacteria bacterium]|nr:uridine kinase [Gammaproteobacteria bacterium]